MPLFLAESTVPILKRAGLWGMILTTSEARLVALFVMSTSLSVPGLSWFIWVEFVDGIGCLVSKRVDLSVC